MESAAVESAPSQAAALPHRGLFALALGLTTLLALAMQWWVYANKVYWISSDESGRTLLAWAWANAPKPDLAKSLLDTWPPLPRILTGLALKYVHSDIFVTPRAITTVFSLLALAALMALAHELFASRWAILATGALAALYGQRLVLSVVPLAEMQYFAWLLLGLFCALRGFNRGRPLWHLAAALALALAMMTRYEAWLFGGLYLLTLTWLTAAPPRRVPWWTVAGCALLILLFPACWIGLFAKYTGKPFGFIENTAGLFKGRFGADRWLSFRLSAISQFFRNNYAQLNLIGLIGAAAWAWRAGAARCWLVIPAGALLGLSALGTMGKAMPTHNFWRISSAWGMLLIPFTAACCVNCVPQRSWLGRKLGRGRMIPGALLFGALAVLFVHDARFMRMCFETIPDVVQAGEQSRHALEESRRAGGAPWRILIESTPDYNHLNVEVMARDFAPFVQTAELNRAQPAPPWREPEQSTYINRLHALNVHRLIYRTPVFKQIVTRYPGVRALGNCGAYTIFELQ